MKFCVLWIGVALSSCVIDPSPDPGPTDDPKADFTVQATASTGFELLGARTLGKVKLGRFYVWNQTDEGRGSLRHIHTFTFPEAIETVDGEVDILYSEVDSVGFNLPFGLNLSDNDEEALRIETNRRTTFDADEISTKSYPLTSIVKGLSEFFGPYNGRTSDLRNNFGLGKENSKLVVINSVTYVRNASFKFNSLGDEGNPESVSSLLI